MTARLGLLVDLASRGRGRLEAELARRRARRYARAPAVVYTTRLTLRPLNLQDFGAHYAAVDSDPAVTWDSREHSPAESMALLEWRIRERARCGFGIWAVIDKESGAFLGHCGLEYLEDTPEVELCYYLARSAWGRGFATEAARAALDFGFTQLGLKRIVAVVRPENSASQRVLAKLGFRYLGPARHYGFEVQLWNLSRRGFESQATREREAIGGRK
ncbi:MAG TPA: GNAT family N-acetyltransferase [Chloroflexota bacterium]|nr:GNAT family N-acetyltransferase [Chloroflexota bacterium]